MRAVAYQGIPGSFSHQAAGLYFGKDAELVSKSSFDDVFTLLDRGEADVGILPVENSSVGMISRVFDLLSQYNLNIQGELYLEVKHNLLAPPGTQLKDIEEVYSHPQAIGQCHNFLEEHTKWKVIPYFDTAKSAKWVKEQGLSKFAAIASTEAASLYGLDIIAENIQDNTLNYTRFIVIAMDPVIGDDCNKISINISLSHTPGSLYKVVEQFAKNNLNMLSIKSRPIVTKPFEYMFYIDFEGHIDDPNVKTAIEGIKDHCSNYKLLGNYKGSSFNRIL
ncbi:MAG: prephenate dehydratase [Clostridiales bacterium]|nr:prephenate dehydratase [Clostridiales bacterium]